MAQKCGSEKRCVLEGKDLVCVSVWGGVGSFDIKAIMDVSCKQAGSSCIVDFGCVCAVKSACFSLILFTLL